jgi:hypothetical protein
MCDAEAREAATESYGMVEPHARARSSIRPWSHSRMVGLALEPDKDSEVSLRPAAHEPPSNDTDSG